MNASSPSDPQRTPSMWLGIPMEPMQRRMCDHGEPFVPEVKPSVRNHLEPNKWKQATMSVEYSDYQARQVTALRRALAWFLFRHDNGTLDQIHADNWNIGAFEMDNAPVETLKTRLDDLGNFHISFGEKGS